jgi:hypothetical protein
MDSSPALYPGRFRTTYSGADPNIKWELNVDVSDVDFGLDFPRNTRVFDQRTREEWVIDSSGKKHDLANVLTTKAMADLTGERARSR